MTSGVSHLSPPLSVPKATNSGTRIIALFIALGVIYVTLTCVRACYKPFWYDEIFTLTVADQPDAAHMWKAYWAGFEYNPPLIYLATRFSQALGRPAELFARLPSMIGYLVMMVCIGTFIGRRLPFPFALAALSFPLISEPYEYAYEARPYGILLGFAGVALLGWQTAADRESTLKHRRLGLFLLFIGMSGALLCHCYAVLLYLPIGAGELWRSWERRRLDLPILAVLGASVAPVALYPALLAASHRVVMGGIFAPTGRRFVGAYAILLRRALLPLAVLLAPLVAIALRRRHEYLQSSARLLEHVPAHEVIAAIGFVLVPASGFLGARILNSQYITRYGLAATLGIAILLSYATYILGGGRRQWAAWMAIAAAVWFIGSFVVAARSFPHVPRTGNRNEGNIMLATSTGLPVVISEGRAFLSFAYYLPPQSARDLVYVADPSDAARLTGSNLVDVALVLASPWLPVPAKVEEYSHFLSHNKRFVLFAPNNHPLEWIYRKLQEDGARLQPMGHAYMYEVTIDAIPMHPR